jgi:glycosyltransferase involved in cell wall biosynthesis
LTTDAGGAKECFLEGETGYLSESDSVGSISEKLSSILSDKKFLNDSKSKSIEFAKEAFGEDTWAKKINKLYLGK